MIPRKKLNYLLLSEMKNYAKIFFLPQICCDRATNLISVISLQVISIILNSRIFPVFLERLWYTFKNKRNPYQYIFLQKIYSHPSKHHAGWVFSKRGSFPWMSIKSQEYPDLKWNYFYTQNHANSLVAKFSSSLFVWELNLITLFAAGLHIIAKPLLDLHYFM